MALKGGRKGGRGREEPRVVGGEWRYEKKGEKVPA